MQMNLRVYWVFSCQAPCQASFRHLPLGLVHATIWGQTSLSESLSLCVTRSKRVHSPVGLYHFEHFRNPVSQFVQGNHPGISRKSGDFSSHDVVRLGYPWWWSLVSLIPEAPNMNPRTSWTLCQLTFFWLDLFAILGSSKSATVCMLCTLHSSWFFCVQPTISVNMAFFFCISRFVIFIEMFPFFSWLNSNFSHSCRSHFLWVRSPFLPIKSRSTPIFLTTKSTMFPAKKGAR
jgi:hypothetical protein